MPEGDADELKPKDASLAMGIGLDRHNAAVAASAKKANGRGKCKKGQNMPNKLSCKNWRLSVMQVSGIVNFLHEQKLISKSE